MLFALFELDEWFRSTSIRNSKHGRDDVTQLICASILLEGFFCPFLTLRHEIYCINFRHSTSLSHLGELLWHTMEASPPAFSSHARIRISTKLCTYCIKDYRILLTEA